MESLTSRQQSIFNAVIERHIESGEPVGSRAITQTYRERYQASFSPATVRMELAMLEEMGYLTHPHTSAGRVPTDSGYRYYVDHCLLPEPSGQELLSGFHQDLISGLDQVEEVLARATQVLSVLTGQMGLVVVPKPAAADGGYFQADREGELFLQGFSRLLEKPEFQNMERVRHLYQILEKKVDLIRWLLRQRFTRQVTVMIGHENEPEALQDCSVVAAACSAKGRNLAVIAVLGPKRMPYARALPAVERMGKALEQLFGERIRD